MRLSAFILKMYDENWLFISKHLGYIYFFAFHIRFVCLFYAELKWMMNTFTEADAECKQTHQVWIVFQIFFPHLSVSCLLGLIWNRCYFTKLLFMKSIVARSFSASLIKPFDHYRQRRQRQRLHTMKIILDFQLKLLICWLCTIHTTFSDLFFYLATFFFSINFIQFSAIKNFLIGTDCISVPISSLICSFKSKLFIIFFFLWERILTLTVTRFCVILIN